jgi:hypothetical protein
MEHKSRTYKPITNNLPMKKQRVAARGKVKKAAKVAKGKVAKAAKTAKKKMA